MKCRIMHESGRRMRIRTALRHMTMREADILEYYLRDLSYVSDVTVYDRAGDAVIVYARSEETRADLIRRLAEFSCEDERAVSLVPEKTGRALSHEYEDRLALKIMGMLLRRFFFPAQLCML